MISGGGKASNSAYPRARNKRTSVAIIQCVVAGFSRTVREPLPDALRTKSPRPIFSSSQRSRKLHLDSFARRIAWIRSSDTRPRQSPPLLVAVDTPALSQRSDGPRFSRLRRCTFVRQWAERTRVGRRHQDWARQGICRHRVRRSGAHVRRSVARDVLPVQAGGQGHSGLSKPERPARLFGRKSALEHRGIFT